MLIPSKGWGSPLKNESYLINILRFIGVVDEAGRKTEQASKVFNLHDDAQFKEGFATLVRQAYQGLFEDYGDAAWQLDSHGLITYFRQADESSSIVGTRQANTFRGLAAIAGFDTLSSEKSNTSSKPRTPRVKDQKKAQPDPELSDLKMKAIAIQTDTAVPFGLSVRVEVNLPSDADQETYDKIFQSIRKNLIDGK